MNDKWKSMAQKGKQLIQNEIEKQEKIAQHWEAIKSQWSSIYMSVGHNLIGYFKAWDNKSSGKIVTVTTNPQFRKSGDEYDYVKFYTVLYETPTSYFKSSLTLKIDMIDGYKKCRIGYVFNKDKSGLLGFGKRFYDFDYWGKRDGYITIEIPDWNYEEVIDSLTSNIIPLIEQYALR